MTYLGHQRFDSATVCARGFGWSVPHPGGQTISDVSISVVVGMKVNIGEQRESRLATCTENRSRCCHLSADVCRGMLPRTGSQSVLVHRTAPVMVFMVLFSCTSTRLLGQRQCCRSPMSPQAQRTSVRRNYFKTFRQFGETQIMVLIADISIILCQILVRLYFITVTRLGLKHYE